MRLWFLKKRKRFVLLRPDRGDYYAAYQTTDLLWTPVLKKAMRFTEREIVYMEVHFSSSINNYTHTVAYEVDE